MKKNKGNKGDNVWYTPGSSKKHGVYNTLDKQISNLRTKKYELHKKIEKLESEWDQLRRQYNEYHQLYCECCPHKERESE